MTLMYFGMMSLVDYDDCANSEDNISQNIFPPEFEISHFLG